MDIYERLLDAQKQGKACALATIVKTAGCSPRSAGTKMLVFEDGSFEGTVGGGDAERKCIEDCLEAIRSGEPRLAVYSPEVLAAGGAEPACKKNIQVFIEPSRSEAVLYLLGGGHVAQAVLPVAKRLGFRVIIYDVRDLSAFSAELAGADEIRRVGSYAELASEKLAAESAVLICTHSHATDGEAAQAVIGKRCCYLGMLGAKHKFVPIFRTLLSAGVPMEKIRSIYAPAGLDLGGESPDAIAVSIMAEIMAVRYGRSAAHLRDVKRTHIFAELDAEYGTAEKDGLHLTPAPAGAPTEGPVCLRTAAEQRTCCSAASEKA